MLQDVSYRGMACRSRAEHSLDSWSGCVECLPEAWLHGRVGTVRKHEPRATDLRVILLASCCLRLESMQQQRHLLAYRHRHLQSRVRSEATCTVPGEG